MQSDTDEVGEGVDGVDHEIGLADDTMSTASGGGSAAVCGEAPLRWAASTTSVDRNGGYGIGANLVRSATIAAALLRHCSGSNAAASVGRWLSEPPGRQPASPNTLDAEPFGRFAETVEVGSDRPGR